MIEHLKSAHKRIRKLRAKLKRASMAKKELEIAKRALHNIKQHQLYQYETETDGYYDVKLDAGIALREMEEVKKGYKCDK